MFDRKIFFDHIRASIFHGKLTTEQVEGINRILDYRESNHPELIDEQFAYVLATPVRETGGRMVPVREGGGEAYLRGKRYYPWVGEGLVQVTWEVNARKFGAQKPGDCMGWPVALRALFEGMIKGMFTGRKLSNFISAAHQDYVNARTIINGHDCAAMIAAYATHFLEALHAARAGVPHVVAEKPAPHAAH